MNGEFSMGGASAGIWVWLLVMLGIMSGNNLLTSWRGYRHTARQTKRLRIALKMELAELLRVYNENLRLLAQQRGYVMSGRAFVSVIRGNLERVTMLEEAEMTAVIAAFSHNERIEALVAAHAMPRGGAAFRLHMESAPLQEIRRKYQIGRERVRAALDALNESGKPETEQIEAASGAPEVPQLTPAPETEGQAQVMKLERNAGGTGASGR
jgi:hypothetical protein